MISSVSSRSKVLNLALKLTIVVVMGWFCLHTLRQERWDELSEAFRENLIDANPLWLVAAGSLTLLNWLLEAEKWRVLNRVIDPISLSRSVVAVLMGVAVSIFTPNRLGEYLGRIIPTRLADKWKAIAAQFLGSAIQLAMLSVFGLLSLSWLSQRIDSFVVDQRIKLMAMALTLVLLPLIILWLPKVIGWLSNLRHHNLVKGILRQIVFLKEYRQGELSLVVLLTFFRMAIYVGQYLLLLRFFGVDIAIADGCAAILLTYLIQSGLPLPPLMGLVARGEVTLLVWNFLAANEISVLASSYLLWVINVLLPALVGTVFLVKTDFLTSFGFEKD